MYIKYNVKFYSWTSPAKKKIIYELVCPDQYACTISYRMDVDDPPFDDDYDAMDVN